MKHLVELACTPDFLGMATGLAGALMLAVRGPRAGWGFVLFFASNVAWAAYAWQHLVTTLLLQQAAFGVSSILGIWTWLVRDRVTVPPGFQDTRCMEADIVAGFDGTNAMQLAKRWRITVREVYEILEEDWRTS